MKINLKMYLKINPKMDKKRVIINKKIGQIETLKYES